MSSIQSLLFEQKYDNIRNWIKNQRNNNRTWNLIKYGLKGDEEGLIYFLREKEDNDFWTITLDDWYLLIDELIKIEASGKPGFIGEPKRPILSAPISEGSCWIKYKKKLEKNGFLYDSISNIELSTIRVISNLSNKTSKNDPVRGIVVGNVQSGKTANMAAVMAMAADYGYNFFIVLSGTIDNLRKQTRDRLISDLNYGNGNLVFKTLDNLSSRTNNPDRLQDLFLSQNDKVRYMTVCLKNSSRLKDLLNWLNLDHKKKGQLKVLIIDDEADQAGINTANISKQLLSTINACIKSLVFSKNSKHLESFPYHCMNYIGYTATPYANFLNEANNSSLYPKNFILTLTTPGDYIGPQQIFGIPDVNLGLPIVNIIGTKEVDFNKKSINSSDGYLPLELKKALHWFICTVAIFRYWKLSKPVSMLIHTSQRIENHSIMEKAIVKYFRANDNIHDLIEEIKKVWVEQTKKLCIDQFKEEMEIHPYLNKVKAYPSFDDFIPELKKLLEIGIKNIMLNDEDNTLKYSEGLHLCVDNCSNSYDDENVIMRLIYPDKNDNETLTKCPAFIVIGGSTLSRGLTIEGLTSTYFLRTTTTADTLMQMGRWFGYRKGYELLSRIWLSQKSLSQFKRLTKLDYDLREELHNMESLNLSPSQYGPRLDNFPDFKILKITNKNKMQSAYEISFSYSNKTGQTTKFFSDKEIIKNNYIYTYKFINGLGKIDYYKIKKLNNPFVNDNTYIWFEVDYIKVLEYLGKLSYPVQLASINDIEHIKEWFKKEYEKSNLTNWNIIVSGVNKGNVLEFENFKLRLPNRRKIKDDESQYIKLKAITSPNDRLVDIDCNNLEQHELESLKSSNGMTYKEKRVKYGKLDTPLLILYIIDKDSGKLDNVNLNDERIPLNIDNHLVGYYIYIPYGNTQSDLSNTNKVTVKLDYDWGGDIDEDENKDS